MYLSLKPQIFDVSLTFSLFSAFRISIDSKINDLNVIGGNKSNEQFNSMALKCVLRTHFNAMLVT